MDSTFQLIEQRVSAMEKGQVFFPDSFATLGSSQAVRSALTRMVKAGTITRIAQGIYCVPKVDEKWGFGTLMPSLKEIAKAIAQRDRVQIVPCEDYVLNLLGLSTQVPVNAVFVTNGSPRRINVGGGKGILFLHSSEMRIFAYQSELMQFIVMAMRAVGEGKVTDGQMAVIGEHLSKVADDEFEHDINLAPVWVRKMLELWRKR